MPLFQICHLSNKSDDVPYRILPEYSARKPWRCSSSEVCTTDPLSVGRCPHVTMLHCCMPPLLMPLVTQIQWCYAGFFQNCAKTNNISSVTEMRVDRCASYYSVQKHCYIVTLLNANTANNTCHTNLMMLRRSVCVTQKWKLITFYARRRRWGQAGVSPYYKHTLYTISIHCIL